MKTGILAVMFIALLAAAIVIIELVRVPNMYAVSGEGEIKYRPDRVEIAIGYYTESETSVEAVQQAAATMRHTLAALRAMGAKDTEINSTSVRTDLVQDDNRTSAAKPQKPLYFAYQSIVLKVDDLTRLGKILDEIAKAGANYWLVTYEISDEKQKELSKAAHQAALADANARADAYAKNGSFKRGRILKIQEGSTTFPDADYYNRDYQLGRSRGQSYYAARSPVEKVTVTGTRIAVKDTTFDIPPPKEEVVSAGLDVLFEIQ